MYCTVPITMPGSVRNCVAALALALPPAERAHLGQPEIQHGDVAARRDHDVGRLDVAVHDAFGMRRIERVGHLNGDVDGFVERQRRAGDSRI